MDRKEKVLAYIKSKEYLPLKIEELAAVLGVPQTDMPLLENILSELCDEGKIFVTKRKRYEPNNSKKNIVGTLSCSAYGFFGLVNSEDGNVLFVKGERLSGALDGDKVLAAVDYIDPASKKADGHIVKILEHKNCSICGVIKRKKRDYFSLYPDSRKIYTHVHIKEEDLLGAKLGDRVVAEITRFLPNETLGIVKKNLGSEDELKSATEYILFSEGIVEEFPEDVLLETEKIPNEITFESGRKNFKDLLTVTIDGDDARDFDDAVSLEMCRGGNYRLGVHIADVSNYVREGTALDKEAFKRGTSVYIPDRVIPMLPQKLSNGICSLNPHEDRLAFSVIMEISKDGNVISHELCESVICSNERMTYNDVAALLEQPTDELLKKYGYLLPMLGKMKELSDILRKKRADRGSIDFDFPESDIVVNEKGEPIDIRLSERKISHKMIEDFMLCANETIAEYAFWAEIPFIYRVHEPPSFENMCDFQKFISSFGLGIKEKFSETEPIHPKSLSRILDKIKGMDEEHMISVYTLRSLMKAEYKAENLGHFGLAAKYYCHFTSPIRRYPDLAIHRILKDFIHGKNLDGYVNFVEKAAKHSSETERIAQETERKAEDYLKAYYMSQYIGYIFDAKISSVTEFGIFAELENTVEGLIRVENLKDDYYIFDDESRTLMGRDNGRVYKIGDCIEIAVASCDPIVGRIDFIPAEGADMSDIDRFQKREYKHRRERRKKINNARRRGRR